MKTIIFCQSCGMPLENDNKGTEKDMSKSNEYCKYCYEKGEFKKELTMGQMIKTNLKYMKDNTSDFNETDAFNQMNRFFPTLKRWKKD
ncbi:MAG: zinc ribbon domain-containing protein [Methanobacteriaceae archaeon]|jgi:hypothetical protein|nr:zinc ribbon domain-containing protein [Methanobacteriaceae archaeon]